ncbi:type II toxin-antitoxin system VapC family toxin [Microlunatus elymi]|uniref:Ribonuclease VapC n=1 Tax=Microlunatus elymi TaxID=2596828 RepID=A0A516PZ44_9ACTN|nr:type II toxin-antitoxin system VapC family toxin [Microlunatus elymi]QDP96427.1 type II toxin-antitoxin system VapC family toxin [Microlunatus elymi]
MIVDTSAVIAILFFEPEADEFFDHLASERAVMSAASYVECSVVTDRATTDRFRRPVNPSDLRAYTRRAVDRIVTDLDILISPVTREQADLARTAHRLYGAGSGSPARLNFGDCFSYALAKDTDQPLLYKGTDFDHTDVRIFRR